MEVTNELLNKLAHLSMLSFSEAEKTALKVDLQNMISFVDKLAEVDTSNVEPLLHLSNSRAGRTDEAATGFSNEVALQNAKQSAAPFFVVPKVIKK